MSLATFLDCLQVGTPRLQDGLAVVPLLGTCPRPPDFLGVAEALALGLIQIDELPDGPQVNRVLVRNRADLRCCSSTARRWSAPGRIAS
jgi:hypothetical protein